VVVLLAAGSGKHEAVTVPKQAKPVARDAYVKPLGAAVNLDAARDDRRSLVDLTETFTSVTPENAMKWEVVEPDQGRFAFDQADTVVGFAERTGKRIRGHPLVWDQQVPAWVRESKDVMAALRRHVTTMVERYKGRVEMWDVVNEPLEDDGTLTRTPWSQAAGERFIDEAFRAAHAADPKARLFLNELAAERPGPKLRALLALAGRLKQRGVPIDGIGLQNHTNTANPPTEADLRRTFGRIAALGLDVEITEMDVTVPPDGDLAAQARAYAAAARACVAAPNCTGLTVWGVTDKWSWLGAEKRPLLFDASGDPKPALTAVRDALTPR
jgi:endo-1,4-beta-xylanase